MISAPRHAVVVSCFSSSVSRAYFCPVLLCLSVCLLLSRTVPPLRPRLSRLRRPSSAFAFPLRNAFMSAMMYVCLSSCSIVKLQAGAD